MSKMPAKKKSCFQITSVTQAQVAASNITDDTESLDDPDESRTEDVSSEIFDVSRTELGVCDRSSSEETLNNVGETQEAPLTAPVNGGLPYNKTGPHLGTNVPAPGTTQPALHVPAATVAPVSTCSSRFRVIKLDHGTGEPFRRGRWTCTEFHDRDSDSNANRTVDSIKPAVTLDHSMDRDSGLGTISNTVVSSASSSQALENAVDTHLVHSGETVHQGYSLVPQIGSGASAFQPTGYSTTASKQMQHAQVNMQPAAPQTFLSNHLNGAHQGAVQPPVMPPASQVQQLAYSNHHQQHFGSSTLPLNLPSSSQGPSPLTMPSGSIVQGVGGEAPASQGVLLHMVSGSGQQQPLNQAQPSGGLKIAPTSSVATSHSVVQNVPVTAPSTTSTPPGGASPSDIIQSLGAHGLTVTGLQSGVSNHAEDTRPKSEALPHPSASVVPGKDGMRPFITEGLSLPSPAVNSLFGIHIAMDGDEDSASGASVVAIDNKIEQAMDLVKSHLMYAVREEVEVLKEQIKELYERNSMLERENAVLKSLANSEQLNHLTSQLSQGGSSGSDSSSTSPPPPPQQQQHSAVTNSSAPLAHHEGSQSGHHQPNITSA
ncbi:TSC22 domain family protein 2 isoform X2 [Dunckerocampus dactyliophorus]|uniref:TSC22 domain family protein 2 isoform X2 n=1 Tax=Dunckerocampus dactyliophorus TaxID=161453 RepID=UPI002406BC05|nr:TSC22 domain family protein 2 isoform X2 [Dunckerocampus dactyliophorus]